MDLIVENLEEAIITKTDIGTLGFCNNKGHKIIEHISDQLIGEQIRAESS